VRDLVDFLASADPVQIAYPDDVLGEAADGLYGALETLGDRLDALNASGSAWSGRLSADLRLINSQFNDILETLLDTAEDAAGGGEDAFTDVSETDVGAATSGKILSCVNRGGVSGDLCAGGVAGAMAVEVELDPEDDNLFSDTPIYRRAYELKVILQSCVNEGPVEARRDWAGGLCGRMSLGLILDCEGYGQISSENGDYVGGAAGFAAGSVRDCWVKCVLSGGRYVGGVVGAAGVPGSGEGGTVTGCTAFVRAAEYERDAGAVSGADLGEFRENVFVSDDLAGLGRISLAGQAEPITYEQLLALEGLPAPFKRLTVRFLAEDRVVRTEELPYGGSLSAEDFPDAPRVEGQYAVWDAGDLTGLTFDADVTAVYAPFLTALASAETRSDGRPVLFVEGRFSGGDAVTVTAVQADGGVRGETERWEISVPRDGSEVHTLRYLSPNGSPEGLEVYQLEDGQWARLDAETVGSYLVFDVRGENPTVAVAARSGAWWVWLTAGFGIIALVLVCRALAGWLKSRKRKAQPDPKGRRGRLLRLAGAALALLVGAGVCLIASGTLDRLAAVRVLDGYLKQEEFALDLTVQASAGEERWSAGTRLYRVPLEGRGVTVARQFGAALCCANGTVYLENGAALPLDGGGFPDYGSLLDRARELYRRGKVSVFSNGSEKIYSLLLEEEDFRQTVSLLPETVPARLERLNAAEVSLTVRSGKLAGLKFQAAGQASGGRAVSLTASFTALDAWEAPEIPEAARAAILAGETGDREDAAGLRRLLSAWVSLNLRDPLSAQIELSADCGPLVVHDQLELFRAWTGGKQAVCLSRAGKDAYFSGGKLYDGEGNALELEDGEAGPEEREALLELACRLCLRGTAECTQEKDGAYRYTLALSGADLEEAAGAILPQAGALEASLTGGRLEVLVEDGEISRAELSCSGSLRVLLADVEVRLACGMTFQPRPFTLPQAVADAISRG